MRAPVFRGWSLLPDELVVDSFAGGGGASIGIEAAIGRPVDIAINHSAEAIAMHKANHPETRHFCEDIWAVDPIAAAAGRPVGLAWFSPDCTHFSRAKGGQPRRKEIRGLAWVVIDWAKKVKPRMIFLENVEEFATWGPLDDDGHPVTARIGETFREWLGELTACGYSIEFKSLVAADFGTPTTRKRLFLVARRDGAGLVWPDRSHGAGRAQHWRPAAEIIDWSLPCPSIFDRKRALADATMKRIAAGIQRYVIGAAQPFVLPLTHQGGTRGRGVGDPMATQRDRMALSSAFLMKYHGGAPRGQHVDEPIRTLDTSNRFAEVRAFLTKFYGSATHGASLDLPLPTVTGGGGHLGLVMIAGEAYEIADIGMRMLQPHELFAAQGFPDDYDITTDFNGKPLTKTAQTALAGNSVCPQVAEALIAANARQETRVAA